MISRVTDCAKQRALPFATCWGLFVLLAQSACGPLKPEAAKSRSPDKTYQYASVSATYDVASSSWSYSARMNMHADTNYGDVSALVPGESVSINGEAPTGVDSSVSKTGIPPNTFTFVWTTSDGRNFTNECSFLDFTASDIPASQTRSGGFSVTMTAPLGAGTGFGGLSQETVAEYRAGGYHSLSFTEANPAGVVSFSSSDMTNLTIPDSTAILSLSWNRTLPFTNVTAPGGSCYISVAHRHKFVLTN